MDPRTKWGMVTLLACCTFFNYGCTTAQRKELLKEGLNATKEYVEAKLPAIKEAASEAAIKKISEMEAKQLASLNVQLSQFRKVDPELGLETVRTWKDFDANSDGSLDSPELAKIASYIAMETSKRAASGEVSKDEASKIAKSSGATLIALTLLMLLKRGADKFAKKPPAPPPTSG